MTARAILFLAFFASSLLPGTARADAGHDHGAPAPASGGQGGAAPRLEAHSDLFEIVGVVQNGALTLFVDRFASNEPVVGATIEVEAGSAKGPAQPNPDGTYTFKHAAFSQAGQLPVTLAITAGSDNDLVAGELVIGTPAAAGAVASDDLWRKRWWWAAAPLLVLAAIVIAWRSRRHRAKGTA